MARTILDGIGSSGLLSVAPGLPGWTALGPEVAALTMTVRLAPNPLAGWRGSSQECQAGGHIALELAVRAGPAHQGREALDPEAGSQQGDHRPIVGAGNPGGGGAAGPDVVHQVADHGRGEGVVQQSDRSEATGLRAVAVTEDFAAVGAVEEARSAAGAKEGMVERVDRKSTRLNSSHANISYAVFC